MFCPKCGANVDDGTRFCSECGTDVTIKPTPQPVATHAQNTYHQQPQSQYTAPQPAYRPAPPPSPQYAQPAYQPQSTMYSAAAPMSVGQYIITFIITAIPIVGFIMLLVWSFGSSTNQNKKNFSRAMLILYLIGIVAGIIFSIISAIVAASTASSFYTY